MQSFNCCTFGICLTYQGINKIVSTRSHLRLDDTVKTLSNSIEEFVPAALKIADGLLWPHGNPKAAWLANSQPMISVKIPLNPPPPERVVLLLLLPSQKVDNRWTLQIFWIRSITSLKNVKCHILEQVSYKFGEIFICTWNYQDFKVAGVQSRCGNVLPDVHCKWTRGTWY